MIDFLNRHRRYIVMALLAASLLLWLLPRHGLPGLIPEDAVIVESLPDFSTYQQIKKKKKAFFEFLYPVVSSENQHILEIRQQVILLQKQQVAENALSDREIEWLKMLAKAYRIKETPETLKLLNKLITRIDIIPPSLVLSQAAIESGWGSSRFAKQGNNLFGQWCFRKGCGIVPQQRLSNEQHEVAAFESINDSVRAYMKNLNSFPAYQTFRGLRAAERTTHQNIAVSKLLAGLENYSEQGPDYITKIAKLIRQNKLEHYDL